MSSQKDLAFAFQLFEEEKNFESKTLYEEIMEKNIT